VKAQKAVESENADIKVLQYTNCYHSYSIVIVTVLPWLQYCHSNSVTMVTVLSS